MTIVGAFLAFIVTVLFIFALRPVAEEVGLVDVPGGRKRHETRVPLIGGVAMAVGLGFGSSFVGAPPFWYSVLLGIYLLVAVGTVDDRYELSPGVRLIAQTCAAMLVVFGAQMSVTHLGSPLFFDLPLGPLGALFSVLFVVALINAFNVIDGLDGLAGGLAFIALATGALLAVSSELFIVLILVLAVVSAFLLFNLPLPYNRPVRVFMGDAGSTSLGLAVAALGIAICQTHEAQVAPVIGLWLIAVPVFDLFAAIARRLVDRRSVFEPDHDHMHHVLIDHGLSRRAALAVMLCLAAVLAGIGLAGHVAGAPDGVMLLGWIGAGVAYYQLMRRPAWLAGWRRAES
jgi:UDP-GlcNAc:undecaprenyl-phosphate/decaprenyl-phosphate GlcNAc-1-phosphate transferase